MNDFRTMCDAIGDLRRFSALDYGVVERGLIQGLDQNAAELQKSLGPVHVRLVSLSEQVKAEFVGRNDAIEAVVASLISGVPAVLLGPPGTAKSAIVRELARRCGLGPHQHGQGDAAQGYFEYLLTSHTMPEELFGAPDLKLLTNESIFQRNTDGMLPRAQLAFLDEVFRGGSHILNTLLTLLNERLFHDGQKVIRVPLVGVVAASNDPPLDPDVGAFFDRFPIRVWLDSIFQERPDANDAHRVAELMKASARHEMRNLRTSFAGPGGGAREQLACTNDFRCARILVSEPLYVEYVDGTVGPGAAARNAQFNDLFRQLFRRAGLSDRTLFALRRFAQALSWLTESASSGKPKTAHFRTFRFLARNAQENRKFEMEVHDALQGSGHTGVA